MKRACLSYREWQAGARGLTLVELMIAMSLAMFVLLETRAGSRSCIASTAASQGWAAQAIVRGVEAFQVLYGLDSDQDGLPNRYVSASVIEAMDVRNGGEAVSSAFASLVSPSYWKRVVAVRVAILVRSSQAVRADAGAGRFDLFGEDYSRWFGNEDVGVRVQEGELPDHLRHRARKLFSTTILLRNRVAAPSP